MKYAVAICFLFLCVLDTGASFLLNLPSSPYPEVLRKTMPRASSETAEEPFLTDPEKRVLGLLENIHASKLEFRVVVVGNGAILESTTTLGPKMKLSRSPLSGANLVTFASEDSSFEFHLQPAQVSKVAMVEKQGPTSRTVRVLRFINDVGKPVCSLILKEDSDEAVAWFRSIIANYGEEMQL